MKIVLITTDKKQHEAELPEELLCSLDVLNALKNNINPAEALLELAIAGSSALRGKNIKPEENETLMTMLMCD